MGWSVFSHGNRSISRRDGSMAAGTANNHVSIGLFPRLGKVSQENWKRALEVPFSQGVAEGMKLSVMKSVLSATFNMGR
jgi:hypothetical protein